MIGLFIPRSTGWENDVRPPGLCSASSHKSWIHLTTGSIIWYWYEPRASNKIMSCGMILRYGLINLSTHSNMAISSNQCIFLMFKKQIQWTSQKLMSNNLPFASILKKEEKSELHAIGHNSYCQVDHVHFGHWLPLFLSILMFLMFEIKKWCLIHVDDNFWIAVWYVNFWMDGSHIFCCFSSSLNWRLLTFVNT